MPTERPTKLDKGVNTIEIIIKGTPEEVAALVVAVQGQQVASSERFAVGFPRINSPDAYAYNLVAKHNDVSNRDGDPR